MIPEREPEKWLPHLRMAAGAQITQCRLGEVVTRNNSAKLLLCDCNGQKLNVSVINNWRASLVPAAAVIPAPIAYIKIVAVETSVVEFHSGTGSSCIQLESLVPSGNMRKHVLIVTLSKLEGSSRVLCLYSSAWNNKLGF